MLKLNCLTIYKIVLSCFARRTGLLLLSPWLFIDYVSNFAVDSSNFASSYRSYFSFGERNWVGSTFIPVYYQPLIPSSLPQSFYFTISTKFYLLTYLLTYNFLKVFEELKFSMWKISRLHPIFVDLFKYFK
jgi:hypothetical protein